MATQSQICDAWLYISKYISCGSYTDHVQNVMLLSKSAYLFAMPASQLYALLSVCVLIYTLTITFIQLLCSYTIAMGYTMVYDITSG